ncbi:MAG: NAD(P)H-dependent oxidoreductase [Candidatus Omnitrophica bacterium]|nr:NAD(P)H-dependent oxidoreductase [Candidatus Omnitrophota bacterium]
MQAIIIYYSYTGNTRRVSQFLYEYLKEKGEVDLIELSPLDESNAFLTQAVRARLHKQAKLPSVNFDLSRFDLICFGSPVWAFASVPAMNTYLNKCLGLEGKDVLLFVTYGSGLGVSSCLDYMQSLLSRKGIKQFKRISFQEKKVSNKDFIDQFIREKLSDFAPVA